MDNSVTISFNIAGRNPIPTGLSGKAIPVKAGETLTAVISGIKGCAKIEMRQTFQGSTFVRSTTIAKPDKVPAITQLKVTKCTGNRNYRGMCQVEVFVNAKRCQEMQLMVVYTHSTREGLKAVRQILGTYQEDQITLAEVKELLQRAGVGQRSWQMTGLFNLLYRLHFGNTTGAVSIKKVSSFLELFHVHEKLLLRIVPYLKTEHGEGDFPLVPYKKFPMKICNDSGTVSLCELENILCLVSPPNASAQLLTAFDLNNKSYGTIKVILNSPKSNSRRKRKALAPEDVGANVMRLPCVTPAKDLDSEIVSELPLEPPLKKSKSSCHEDTLPMTQQMLDHHAMDPSLYPPSLVQLDSPSKVIFHPPGPLSVSAVSIESKDRLYSQDDLYAAFVAGIQWALSVDSDCDMHWAGWQTASSLTDLRTLMLDLNGFQKGGKGVPLIATFSDALQKVYSKTAFICCGDAGPIPVSHDQLVQKVHWYQQALGTYTAKGGNITHTWST